MLSPQSSWVELPRTKALVVMWAGHCMTLLGWHEYHEYCFFITDH
jgi:hypothetical protein